MTPGDVFGVDLHFCALLYFVRTCEISSFLRKVKQVNIVSGRGATNKVDSDCSMIAKVRKVIISWDVQQKQ